MSLETTAANRQWLCRCDVMWQTVTVTITVGVSSVCGVWMVVQVSFGVSGPASVCRSTWRLVLCRLFIHRNPLQMYVDISVITFCFAVLEIASSGLGVVTLGPFHCAWIYLCLSVCILCFCFILHSCCIIVSAVGWTWWDWSLILRTYLSSVLWHCWLGHLTCKNPSPICPIMCLVGH